MSPKPTPDETVEVLAWPGAEQAGVVCVVVRHRPDGAPPLDAWVPANVYASVNLILDGAVSLREAPAAALPRRFATGPFTAALGTRTQGRLHAACVVLQPWALPAWCGLQPQALRDGLHDLHGVAACSPWLAALVHCLHDADTARLAPAADLPSVHLPADAAAWSQALLQGRPVQEVAARSALSPRQLQRRFAAVFGLPPKTWQRIKRVEASLLALAGARPTDNAAPIAELAHAGGFADQAHMAREFRHVTGHGPAQLCRGLGADGAADIGTGYWAFRPARVRFVQDATLAAAYAAGHVR